MGITINGLGCVHFDPLAIRNDLDHKIRHWRRKRDAPKNIDEHAMAVCYVDAFQSVRTSIFGEVLE